ncbi:hypothetical protein ACLB2K_047193 [Fragaria x ananassa]
MFTKMITGYARRGRLDDALKLFDEMPQRDVVSWNAMIKGCLDCDDLGKAKELFDGMPEKSVVSWTTMMNGYLQFGEFEMAECLFQKMPARDVAAWNSMIHGCFSYGRVDDANKLFEVMPGKNAISWTSMIAGLDHNGRSEEALVVFGEMVASGVQATLTTFGSVVTACANSGSLDLGVEVHGQIVKLGYCFDEFLAASLITLYANCNQIENSHKVFKESVHRNVVVWTALITGCGSNSKHDDALKVFRDMMISGVLPNQSSFTSALNSCLGLEHLHRGKEIHATAVKLGFETDAFVGNSLIVLYTKCGNVNDGVAVFKRIGEKNVVSWNSTIIGCAQHGRGKWALALFNQMLRAGVDPDEITFTGLLSACSHSGMLQKARGFFKVLSQTKYIEMKKEHYTCMVDVLGRFGELEEAEELIRNLPVQETKMAWLTLLGACRLHSNLDVAERAAKNIFDIEPNCSAACVLLSNIHASANRWSDVSRIREKMKYGGTVKQPGSRLISSSNGIKTWITIEKLGSGNTRAANSPSSSTTSSLKQYLETSTKGQSSPASSLARSKPQAERSKGNVTVTFHFRPLSPREIRQAEEIAWHADGDTILRNEHNPSIAYAHDRVFGPTITTRHVYDVAAQHVVSGAMEGVNEGGSAFLMLSCGNMVAMDLKIYNEEELVLFPAHALSLIAAREEHRHVGSTNFNLLSSRSHTIFTLTIESNSCRKIVKVISKLTDGRATHIPYRDSELSSALLLLHQATIDEKSLIKEFQNEIRFPPRVVYEYLEFAYSNFPQRYVTEAEGGGNDRIKEQLELRNQKLVEESSYAKCLASAAAVELKAIPEEVAKLMNHDNRLAAAMSCNYTIFTLIHECKELQETVASLKQLLSEALEFRNSSPMIGLQTDSGSLHEEENGLLNHTNEVFLTDKQQLVLVVLYEMEKENCMSCDQQKQNSEHQNLDSH